jgi:hypothetical protein
MRRKGDHFVGYDVGQLLREKQICFWKKPRRARNPEVVPSVKRRTPYEARSTEYDAR